MRCSISRGHHPTTRQHMDWITITTSGRRPEINSWETNWVTFFRDYRLRPQIVLAEHNNYLSILQRRNLDRLLVRLDELLGGVERQPALLHGDLWSGNVIAGPQGEPVLIDPAVITVTVKQNWPIPNYLRVRTRFLRSV
ncbi:MAG: fructosamine kinase family protein [Blastochloris sp.]|nr:fructosamine kinase family protein [Blastochloris sp.]